MVVRLGDRRARQRDADGGNGLVWKVETAGSADAISQIDTMLEMAVPMAFAGLERGGA